MGLNKKGARLASAIAIACAMLLTGCDNNDNNQAQNEQAAQQEVQQREIEKYNAYIDAANRSSTDFVSDMENHISYMKRAAKNKNYEYYNVINASTITSMITDVDKALAMSPAINELDVPAKALSTALHNIQPLITELSDYVDSKGFLADKGEKAIAKEAEYVSLMSTLIDAENKFSDAIEKRDEENLQASLAKADKDSPEYYRSAVALYSKRVAQDAKIFYASQMAQTPSKEINDSFKENIDKLAGLTQGCPAIKSEINSLVARGRSALNKAQKGDYVFKSDTPSMREVEAISINSDYTWFERDYGSLINKINRQEGCGVN